MRIVMERPVYGDPPLGPLDCTKFKGTGVEVGGWGLRGGEGIWLTRHVMMALPSHATILLGKGSTNLSQSALFFFFYTLTTRVVGAPQMIS